MKLKVSPLSDAWAARQMLLIARSQPPSQTPLGMLAAHLEASAGVGSSG